MVCWITLRNDDHDPLFCGATPPPSCSFDVDDVMADNSDSASDKMMFLIGENERCTRIG